MINLLPENEKSALQKEYHLRLGVVALVFIFLLVGTAVLLLVPSLVSVITKKKSAEAKIAVQMQEETAEHRELVEEVRQLKEATAALTPDETKVVMPTSIINAIINHKTAGNSITDIRYSLTSEKKLIVVMSGMARTRQSLVALKDGLEKEDDIAKVDLPVSNLASDSDIKFTITITGK